MIKPETDRLDVGVPRIGTQIRVTIVAGVFQRFLYGYGNGIFRGDIVGIILTFIFFGVDKLNRD